MNTPSFKFIVKFLLAITVILVITLWVYHPSTKNGLVWDSIAYIINHVFWISSLSTDNLIWIFLSLEVVNWHPLTWLSWAIDYQVYGGLSPSGFHLSNNVYHSLNSGLVFVLALVVFGLNQPGLKGLPLRKDNPALIAAFLAALLFAIHPQHVESVAWVAERKDLLCQLFLLLATLTYVKYVSCGEPAKKRWLNATLGLFALALMSKPMAVTFPAVLLLIDVYPLRRINWIRSIHSFIKQQKPYYLLREKLPFFLLTIASILITLYAQQQALTEIPLDLRLLNAFNSIIFYLGKFFLPMSFFPQYSYFVEIGEAISWAAFVPLAGVLALTLACLFAWKKGHHAWLAAWLFYLVTLSPVLGLIQVGLQGAADRYAYLPTLPVYLLIGAGVVSILENPKLTRTIFLTLITIPLFLLLADKTRQQIRVWETPMTLWSHAVKLNPGNVHSRHNLAISYLNDEEYEKAAYYFGKNVGTREKPLTSLAWRALSYLYLERYDEALKDYVELEKLAKSRAGPELDKNCLNYNNGWVRLQLGLHEQSTEFFGKVKRDSKLWPSTEKWLDWLNGKNHPETTNLATEELPDFCTKVLSSMQFSIR